MKDERREGVGEATVQDTGQPSFTAGSLALETDQRQMPCAGG